MCIFFSFAPLLGTNAVFLTRQSLIAAVCWQLLRIQAEVRVLSSGCAYHFIFKVHVTTSCLFFAAAEWIGFGYMHWMNCIRVTNVVQNSALSVACSILRLFE